MDSHALVHGSRVSADLAALAHEVFTPDLSPFQMSDWHCAHAIVDRAAVQVAPFIGAVAARYAAM